MPPSVDGVGNRPPRTTGSLGERFGEFVADRLDREGVPNDFVDIDAESDVEEETGAASGAAAGASD